MPSPSLKDLSLSPEELNKVTKLPAKERRIKSYENMSKDKLLSNQKMKRILIKQEQKRLEKKLRNFNMNFLNQK